MEVKLPQPRILIVEDELVAAKGLQTTLSALGYEVPGIASNGEEAMELAAELRPDLVLMNLTMESPRDGIDTACELQKHFRIPSIFLTSLTDDPALQKATAAEPVGYIAKPFDERELHSTIQVGLVRHQLERRLKESEQWLSTSLQSIGDGLIATDAGGKLKFMNPVAEEVLGIKWTGIGGRDLQEVLPLHSDDGGCISPHPMHRALNTGKTIFVENCHLKSSTGADININGSCAPIRDAAGNVSGAILVFRDVTEKRKIEEELLKVKKLESLGLMAGGIAHDFNNILAIILGNVSLAKVSLERDHPIYPLLENMEQAAHRGKQQAFQFLSFTKSGAPQFKPVSLSTMVRHTCSMVVQHDRKYQVRFNTPDDLWNVHVDELQMVQVIQNLLFNALQSMPEGGRLHISMENMYFLDESLDLDKHRDYVELEIRDEGCGVAPENLERIFDPYFTTKKNSSGLGLSICQSVVKKHGGTIKFSSSPGVGTTIQLYLPAAKDRIPMETPPTQSAAFPGKGNILIMDDDEILRETLIRMLAQLGYKVKAVCEGEEALNSYIKARENGQPFDVVLMDLVVDDGMGGEEGIRRILQSDPEARIVVSSGYANHPVISCGNSSVKAFLTKPYDIVELSKVLNDLITS